MLRPNVVCVTHNEKPVVDRETYVLRQGQNPPPSGVGDTMHGAEPVRDRKVNQDKGILNTRYSTCGRGEQSSI